jgi:hypothetical protein
MQSFLEVKEVILTAWEKAHMIDQGQRLKGSHTFMYAMIFQWLLRDMLTMLDF